MATLPCAHRCQVSFVVAATATSPYHASSQSLQSPAGSFDTSSYSSDMLNRIWDGHYPSGWDMALEEALLQDRDPPPNWWQLRRGIDQELQEQAGSRPEREMHVAIVFINSDDLGPGSPALGQVEQLWRQLQQAGRTALLVITHHGAPKRLPSQQSLKRSLCFAIDPEVVFIWPIGDCADPCAAFHMDASTADILAAAIHHADMLPRSRWMPALSRLFMSALDHIKLLPQ